MSDGELSNGDVALLRMAADEASCIDVHGDTAARCVQLAVDGYLRLELPSGRASLTPKGRLAIEGHNERN